jgi:hypothetical protein
MNHHFVMLSQIPLTSNISSMQTDSSNKRIHRTRMRTRIGRTYKRPRPNQAQCVALVLIPVVHPDTIGICLDRFSEHIVRCRLLQKLQIPHEDAFELVPVAATPWFAAIVNDAVVV